MALNRAKSIPNNNYLVSFYAHFQQQNPKIFRLQEVFPIALMLVLLWLALEQETVAAASFWSPGIRSHLTVVDVGKEVLKASTNGSKTAT